MDKIQVIKDEQYILNLTKALDENGPIASWELFKMAYEIEWTLLNESSSNLKAIEYLPHVSFMPHQIESAKLAIEKMSGRAILADEVGLGKTIEACLILKEYMIRGLVQKVLILVPASLINQWIEELHQKFYIQASAYRKNIDWEHTDIIVASIDTAKKEPHKSKILSQKYDMVIVDEAHKLKNENSLNYQFVSAIQKVYCLLLTATPFQNNLLEIFNLISIIRPGLLGNYEQFKKMYTKNRQHIIDHQYIKQLLQNNLIRNSRSETALNSVTRNIKTIQVEFSEKEQTFYNEILEQDQFSHTFTKSLFLRQFCSSREACYFSLENYGKKNECEMTISFKEKIKQLPQHIKSEEVLKIIRSIGNEKVIIFTEFVPTQYYLQWLLNEEGISSVLYNGNFSKNKKDWMIQLFKNKAQVLIATEAGSEGINLQFCHHVINYDLPWNPMKLEQRIGRVHRYGQERSVHIYNLIIKNTVEEHVFQLLFNKLKLFTGVIGDIEKILSNKNMTELEKEIASMIEDAYSKQEINDNFQRLSKTMTVQQKIQ